MTDPARHAELIDPIRLPGERIVWSGAPVPERVPGWPEAVAGIAALGLIGFALDRIGQARRLSNAFAGGPFEDFMTGLRWADLWPWAALAAGLLVLAGLAHGWWLAGRTSYHLSPTRVFIVTRGLMGPHVTAATLVPGGAIQVARRGRAGTIRIATETGFVAFRALAEPALADALHRLRRIGREASVQEEMGGIF